MRRLINVLISLTLIVGVVYGAAKGYFFYRVKQSLDELVYHAEGLGNEFTYGAIETDLRGQVIVKDLSLLAAGISKPLTVQQVRVSGPNALYFLDPRNSLTEPSQGGNPPPRFRVDITQLRSPPLEDLHSVTVSNGKSGSMLPFDNCGSEGSSQKSLSSALGVDELVLDGEVSWDFDHRDERLQLELGVDYPDIQSIYTRVEFDDVTPDMLKGRASIPQLAAFEASVRVEPAFGNRFASVCAERLGITPDEFKARFISEQTQIMASMGLQLGVGLRFAMQTFVDNWGEIRLVAAPNEPVGLMSMVFMPPERLMKTLNTRLNVNDTYISDLSLQWAPPEGGMAHFGALVGNEPPPKTISQRRIRYENYWVKVGAQDLKRHLRREIRLYSADQPPREGILLAIRDGKAEVQQRVHGGRFTAYVPVEQITKADVQLRREIQAASTSSTAQ